MFARSVILMLDHGADGALGVILNQESNTMTSDLAGKIFDEEFDWEKRLRIGGPVAGSFLVLHTVEDMANQEVIPGVYVTMEPSLVQQLIVRRPEPSLIIANYSGWGPGQLEGEFGWDSWLTLPATAELVFWDDDRDLWKFVVSQVRARKLSDFLHLKGGPSDPSLN